MFFLQDFQKLWRKVFRMFSLFEANTATINYCTRNNTTTKEKELWKRQRPLLSDTDTHMEINTFHWNAFRILNCLYQVNVISCIWILFFLLFFVNGGFEIFFYYALEMNKDTSNNSLIKHINVWNEIDLNNTVYYARPTHTYIVKRNLLLCGASSMVLLLF